MSIKQYSQKKFCLIIYTEIKTKPLFVWSFLFTLTNFLRQFLSTTLIILPVPTTLTDPQRTWIEESTRTNPAHTYLRCYDNGAKDAALVHRRL